MPSLILQLSVADVRRSVDVIDPVVLMAEELISSIIVDRPEWNRSDRGQSRWYGLPGEADDPDLTMFELPGLELRCLLPASSLRTFQNAAIAAIAARELLSSGGATVAMLGAGDVIQPQFAVVARHLPDISHVAFCDTSADRSGALDDGLVEELEQDGIRMSVVSTTAEAMFGANLVVIATNGVTHTELAGIRLGQLVRGAVLVNTTGRDLPANLVAAADQCYVDDLDLLGSNSHRRIAEADITADLGQLLAGTHPGREQMDDIVLVDMLGGSALNTRLVHKIVRVALDNGFGKLS